MSSFQIEPKVMDVPMRID